MSAGALPLHPAKGPEALWKPALCAVFHGAGGGFFLWKQTADGRICKCAVCNNMASGDGGNTLCAICASPVRDHSILCVVEESPQIRSIEASGVFRGVYHVLGGRIAPLEGKGVESIDLAGLEKRLDEGEIKEVILALSPDVEGQATSIYIANMLKGRDIAISSPARGLPAGSDLSYADPATIAAALSGRTLFDR